MYPPMGIDSHGNNGHSHSHTGCFPFLPIPIPNCVTNSHYHGNPMGFPFPLGIPFPWSSLLSGLGSDGHGKRLEIALIPTLSLTAVCSAYGLLWKSLFTIKWQQNKTRSSSLARGYVLSAGSRGVMHTGKLQVWLSGVVVSALGMRTRRPRFDSQVAPLFHWVATLAKLLTHAASVVSQLQETGGTKGSFRRLSGCGD